jgi:hypothetical protein
MKSKILLLFSLILASCHPDEKEFIQLKVIEKGSNQAISGATVFLYNLDNLGNPDVIWQGKSNNKGLVQTSMENIATFYTVEVDSNYFSASFDGSKVLNVDQEISTIYALSYSYVHFLVQDSSGLGLINSVTFQTPIMGAQQINLLTGESHTIKTLSYTPFQVEIAKHFTDGSESSTTYNYTTVGKLDTLFVNVIY